MTKIRNSKPVYDLEERTFQFAKNVRLLVIEYLNLEFIWDLVLVIWILNFLELVFWNFNYRKERD